MRYELLVSLGLALMGSPALAELTAEECADLIQRAELGRIQAQILVLDQIRPFTNAVADQDGANDAPLSDEALQSLDRTGAVPWDAYIEALRIDCEAIK